MCNWRGGDSRWAAAAVAAVLLAGCTGPSDEPGPVRRGAALSEGSPLVLALGPIDQRLEQGRVVLRASWGAGEGQLGKRDEASRPGPMSLRVGRDRSIYILDQVNRRVLRYDAEGRLLASLPIAAEATEDMALDGDYLWTLVYEPGAKPGYRVERYGSSGGNGPSLVLPLPRSIQLVTGLFVDGGSQVWVEQRHEVQSLVARGSAGLPAERQTLLAGRADRAGRGFRLSALRSGSHEARVLRVVPDDGMAPLLRVTTEKALVAIQELETDEKGRLFLGLLTGEEQNVTKVMLVVESAKTQVIELSAHSMTDVFRPVEVGHDGSIYQLQSTEEGVTVRRWDLEGKGGGR